MRLSWVAGTTPATSPLVLAGEGASITGMVQATDVAGNTVTSTSPAMKIDRTLPVTTAVPNPAPNAAGWNATNVMIALTATDTLSGVDHTAYTLDGGPRHRPPTTKNTSRRAARPVRTLQSKRRHMCQAAFLRDHLQGPAAAP
jgi:hypothetical protein